MVNSRRRNVIVRAAAMLLIIGLGFFACDSTGLTSVPQSLRVTYQAPGAEGAVPTDSNSYNAQDPVTVMDIEIDQLTKEGHVFGGWQINSQEDKAYNAGETFTINADTTLTAVWARVYVSPIISRVTFETDHWQPYQDDQARSLGRVAVRNPLVLGSTEDEFSEYSDSSPNRLAWSLLISDEASGSELNLDLLPRTIAAAGNMTLRLWELSEDDAGEGDAVTGDITETNVTPAGWGDLGFADLANLAVSGLDITKNYRIEIDFPSDDPESDKRQSIDISRVASSKEVDPALLGLALSRFVPGTGQETIALEPAYSNSELNYSASVADTVTRLTLHLNVNDYKGTLPTQPRLWLGRLNIEEKGNRDKVYEYLGFPEGSGGINDPYRFEKDINLHYGVNTIDLRYRQGFTLNKQSNYILTITRAWPQGQSPEATVQDMPIETNNGPLDLLIVDPENGGETLHTGFLSGFSEYSTGPQTAETTRIGLGHISDMIPASDDATVEVFDSGVWVPLGEAEWVALGIGDNMVAIRVTAEDTNHQTIYNITIPRDAPAGVTLEADDQVVVFDGRAWVRDPRSHAEYQSRIGAGATYEVMENFIQTLNTENFAGANDWRMVNVDDIDDLFAGIDTDQVGAWGDHLYEYGLQVVVSFSQHRPACARKLCGFWLHSTGDTMAQSFNTYDNDAGSWIYKAENSRHVMVVRDNQ